MEGHAPGRQERVLAGIDGLASFLVARAAPIRFALARSDGARDAVFRLRYRVVVEQGWAPPSAFPDGRERDADDDRAVHVVAWDAGELVATARMVFPSAGRRLPTEELFGLAIEPVGRVVNVDRLAVAAAAGSRGRRLLPALLGRVWIEARARGIHVLAGVAEPAVVRLYRSLGLRPEVLGPSRPIWGEERSPIRLDGAAWDVATIARVAGVGSWSPAPSAAAPVSPAGSSIRRDPR